MIFPYQRKMSLKITVTFGKSENGFQNFQQDLKIRPNFTRKQRQIEAHICLSFGSYKVYKELERQ